MALIRKEGQVYKPVSVAHALMKRYVSGKTALDTIGMLTAEKHAIVEIPKLESLEAFAHEVGRAGVETQMHEPLEQIDAKVVRERVELTQEQFALHFGLDVKTVRNWEQGVSKPDATGRSLLTMILRNPDLVRAALNAPIDDGSAAS